VDRISDVCSPLLLFVMSNHLSELPLPLLRDQLQWSQDTYAERFALSYRLISGGKFVARHLTSLAPRRPNRCGRK
jgi:hypothetical protein